MECGGKRSATPLWLESLVLRWIRHKHKPKRRRAALAAALHGRGWFCTAETQAKAASRFACRRTPWQRLVLYRRNTSQSGVALRLPPHSMAEAGFVPQKHKPSGVALRLPPHSILPFQRWGVFVEYVQLLGVEAVDCLHLRRCGCPLKPGRTAPGILVGHRNQSMFHRISMCVVQTGKIGFFVGQTRLAEIVPDLPARPAFQFVNPFGGVLMKLAQHPTHA